MADNFQKPADQANFDALRSQLASVDAQITERIDAAFRSLQEAQRTETARGRATTGGTRSTVSALPELTKEVEAVDQQVVSYTRLNELIAQRIKLEGQAAAAAGATARAEARAAGAAATARTRTRGATAETEVVAASSGTSLNAWLATQRAQVAAQQEKAAQEEYRMGQRQRWTTTSPEAQRVGAAVQDAQAAPARATAAALAELDAAEARAAQSARDEVEALARLATAEREAAASARQLAASEQEARQSIMEAAMAMQTYDDSMGRSGALSTAAIQAMANGTITVRELGNQVAETVGKFGLWAGAAAAVYGALGAVDELKNGAVDVSSSVTALGRFLPKGQYNPGDARQAIVDQGRATATPLNEVGDTAQQFSKVLKNQNDVFTATHVALTAAKLDNITLANSYEYLTAIMQESGVSASKLPGIFDQITAAQDRVGARMSVMLPAVAGSIGAVQSAGGNTSQLIGLEALTSIRTGFQGATIANMFRQGAGNYYNMAAERGVRSRFGINPNEGFTQALIQALQKAPSLTGVERQTLAGGFFGSRYGPRAAPLFRATPQELEHALGETAAGAHPGLANQQLNNAMSQSNNQLAMLKVNLQAIGAELTSSHMTSPFGALLGIINELLKATGDLVQVWDELPGPVKTVGSDMAVVAAVVAGMRRFNIGAMMAGSGPIRGALAPIFSKSPQKMLEAQTSEYMGGLSATITSQLQAATVRQMNASIQLATAQTEMAALEAQGAKETEAYTAAAARAAAAFDAQAAASADVAALSELGGTASMARFRSDFVAASGGKAAGGAVTAEAVAAGAGGAAVAGGGEAAAGLAAAETGVVETTGVMATAMAGVTAGLAFMASHAIPLAIAALVGFDIVKGTAKSYEQHTDQGISGISKATTQAGAARAYNEVVGAGGARLPIIGQTGIGAGIANLLNGTDAAAKTEYNTQLGLIAARQRAMDASGKLLATQVNPDLAKGDAAGALRAFSHDDALKLENRGEYNQIYNQLYTKSEGRAATGAKGQNPFAAWEQASQSLQNQLEPMARATADSADVFGASGSNLKSLADGYAYAVEKFGKNTSDTQAMQALVQFQGELVKVVDKRVQDLTNLAEMATTNKGQASDYTQALATVSTAERQIKEAAGASLRLPGADPKRIHQAEQEALGLAAQRRQTAISGLLSLYSSQTDVTVSNIQGIGPQADLQRATAQLSGYQTQLSAARRMGADASTVNGLLAKVNQQVVTVLQDRVSYYQQMSQALTSYEQGATADPVQQQQIAVSQLSALYGKLVGAGDTDKSQLISILAQKRAAIIQGVADRVSQEQAGAQTSLSQSNIGQPQQVQLGNAVASAQKQLDFILSLPKNQINPQTLLAAYNNLYQAQGALAQFVIQQGQAMIQAEAALKAGETFSPTAMAADALAGAKQLLAFDRSHNMPAAQLKGDAAAVASDMKAQTEARWQQQEATIQFLAQTYQITGATEIQRLQKLMATMKKTHASYQDIQQVASQIFNLEYGSNGGLNLDTGSLHLPSTYEVKSAILGGKLANRRKTAAGLVADVQTNVQMNVTVNRDADMHKFTDALGRALGTSVNGVAQAAGLI